MNQSCSYEIGDNDPGLIGSLPPISYSGFPMDTPTFLAFVFTYSLVAFSPGLCMTLSMTLGISIGVRRALWMMVGELAGIVVVGACAIGGVAALMLATPGLFTVLKFAAAAYLLWAALRTWRALATIAMTTRGVGLSERQLMAQGFVTATSNPKGWIFDASLLPPFINPDQAILPQAVMLLTVIVIIEFICLLIYASGGRALMELLTRRGLDHWLNHISASMMVGVAVWLILF